MEGDAPLRHINLNLAQNTHRPPDDDTSVYWASAIFEETEVKTRTLRARSTGRPMGEETSLTGRSVGQWEAQRKLGISTAANPPDEQKWHRSLGTAEHSRAEQAQARPIPFVRG